MENRSVFIIGSYNGQDSLGDKCLLRVVSSRFRRLLPNEVPIYIHAHDPSELHDGGKLEDLPVTAQRGVQSYYWNWHNKLRHTRLPESLRRPVSAKTFQLAANTVYRNDEVLHSALQQLRSAAFMFVFGGTNFSRQWWAKNIVPYMLMARMADLPVYFGPQQYGPMTAEQQRRTQQFIHERVEGVRFRNPACMSELGMQGETEKLVRDEVFSNTQVYPVVEERSGRAASRKTVLVNFRGEQNFLSDDKSKARLDNLVAYLRGLHNRLDCKFTFFSVSGPEFCDDTECIGYVRQRLPRVEIDQLPYTNAKDHIEAARKAYATVSMSLHGCILSMIGGCPAVPITHGEYYNHKYVGFGKYNPNKNIPIYHVKNEPSSLVIKDSIKYFQNYDPKRVSKERKKSDKKIEKFYTKALNKYGFVEM